MRRRRHLSILTAIILVIALLAGCSKAAPNEMAYPEAGDSIASSDKLVDPGNSAGESTPNLQKKIRTLNMEAETEDLDTLLKHIETRTNALGGYVEKKDVRRGSMYAQRVYRSASLTLRIPAELADSLVEDVGEVSNITYSSETVSDVTLQYVATESRVAALETEHERLLELLANAQSMNDLLLIESRLTDVRAELEKVKSQLRVYDNLVNYATIHLQLQEVKEYTPVEEQTFWQKIGSGLSENFKGLVKFLENFLIFFITSLPYLIPIAIVITLIVLAGKSRKRKKAARKSQQ